MTKRSYIYSTLIAALCGAAVVGCSSTPTPAGGTGASGTGYAGTGASGAGVSGTNGSSGTQAVGGTGGSAAGAGGAAAGAGGAAAGAGGATAGTGGTAGTQATTLQCLSQTPKTGDCKATAKGVYAMKVELDVWFMDEINKTSPLLDPGRGKIDIYLRGEIKDLCDDGSDGLGIMHPCGTSLPFFLNSANCTSLQIQFPDDMWEKPGIPDFNTKGSTTGFVGGVDTLTIAKVTSLLGIDLNDPNTFPTSSDTATLTCPGGKMGADCFPDQDGDGNPGVTVTFRDDGTKVTNPIYTCPGLTPDFWYKAAPLDILGGGALAAANASATKAYIGLQTMLGGAGKIGTDCKSGVGDAVAGDTLPSRVWDCYRKDNMKCDATQAGFLDKNTPIFHVLKPGEMPPATWKHPVAASDAKLDRSASVGPKSSVIRLADPGTPVACADIRNAQFLPFQ